MADVIEHREDVKTLSYGPHSRTVHGVLAFLLLMIFGSAMVILAWDLSGERRGPIVEILAWIAAPYFLFSFVRYVTFLKRHWKSVLVVTPVGLHDVRATKDPVPWVAIEAMALKRETNRMDILVTLTSGRLRDEFGKPRWVPSFRRKLQLTSSSFSIGGGLERNSAGIANDINVYEFKPNWIFVAKA